MCIDYWLIGLAVLITFFLEFCFREKGIFWFWLPFVAGVYYYFKDIKLDDVSQAYMDLSEEESYQYDNDRDYIISEAWPVTSPLGGCVVCMGFWVSAVVLFGSGLLEYVFGILLCSFLIRLFYKYIV